MNKPKMIDTYYCDYCGKECDHTPKIVLPFAGEQKYEAFNMGVKLYEFTVGESVVIKQVDVCPECQNKIAYLAKFIPTKK